MGVDSAMPSGRLTLHSELPAALAVFQNTQNTHIESCYTSISECLCACTVHGRLGHLVTVNSAGQISTRRQEELPNLENK